MTPEFESIAIVVGVSCSVVLAVLVIVAVLAAG